MGAEPSKAEASPYIRYAVLQDPAPARRVGLLKWLAGTLFGLMVILYGLSLCVFHRRDGVRSDRLARFRRYFEGEAYDVPPFMMMVNAYLHTLCEEHLTSGAPLVEPSAELGAGEGSFSQIALTNRTITLISSVQPSDGAHLAQRSVARGAAIIDAEYLPLDASSMRSVYLIDTFYHIRNQKGALADIARSLQDGGVVSFNYVSHEFFHQVFPLVRWGLGPIGRWELRRLKKRHYVDDVMPLSGLLKMIQESGLELVSAKPIASLRAMRMAYLLYWLASPSRFGVLARWYSSPWVRRFLARLIETVFFPHLMTDPRDSSGGRSLYFWITARKKGGAAPSAESTEIRFVCPLCKGPFDRDSYHCARCRRDYPRVGTVPNFLVHTTPGAA